MIVELLSSLHLWTGLAILGGIYWAYSRPKSSFPIVNAYRKYTTNTAKLISEGLAKYQEPFVLARPHANKIVLPLSHAGWVKSNRDLYHRELIRQDFYAGCPGFEGQTALHSEGDMLPDVIKTKLGQNNSIMPVVNASLADVLTIHWGTENTWHAIDRQKDTTAIIAHAASSIFAGPVLARDQEWLTIVQAYVSAYFTLSANWKDIHLGRDPLGRGFCPTPNLVASTEQEPVPS